MKRTLISLMLLVGLIISPTSAFTAQIYGADAVLTPQVGDLMGGLGCFVGGKLPGQYDWTIGNCVPGGTPTDDMVFSTNDDGWQERMRITKEGNVGIGTTEPSYKLHVAGVSGPDTAEFTTTGETSRIWLNATGVGGRNWGLESTSGKFNITDATANANRVTVDTRGNVGIGTTMPTESKLFVETDSAQNAIVATTVNAPWHAVANFWAKDSNYGAGVLTVDASRGDDPGYYLFVARNNRASTVQGKFVIRGDGNVGIGTTMPNYKLDVEGYVQAHGYYTGDITFQKDGHQLWRMFEDEEGLYLESLKTGKVYRFLLQEVVNK
ncbi:MAG: hypothetical protein AB1414_17875 [bacterium]